MEIKKFCMISALLTISWALYCQQRPMFEGRIVEWNSKTNTGKLNYLSGVEVSCPNAKPTKSDDFGKFTLEIANAKLGDLTTLQIYKKDFEVVNMEKISDIGVYRTEPIKIIMCRKGLIEQSRISYYKINIEEISKKYKARVALLQQNDKNTTQALLNLLNKEMASNIKTKEEALEALAKQFDYLKSKLSELSSKFALINLDDESEFLVNAFNLYKKGDLEGAIRTLEEANLPKQLQQIKENKQHIRSIITSWQDSLHIQDSLSALYVRNLSQLADFYILNYQFEKADSCYKTALVFDEGKQGIWRDYAGFLYYENRFSDFFNNTDKLLALAETTTDSFNVIFLNSLQYVFSNKPDSIQAQFISLSRFVEKLKSLDSCNYNYYKGFISCMSAFVENGSEPDETGNKLLKLRSDLERWKDCENADPFFQEVLDQLSLLGLAMTQAPPFQDQYFKLLQEKSISNDFANTLIKVLASGNYAIIKLRQGNYESLLEGLESLDNIYNKADSLSRRHVSFYLIEIYRNIGGDLVRNELSAPAEKYLKKCLSILEKLNYDDPFHLQQLFYLPNVCIDLAYACIRQNKSREIKGFLDQAMNANELLYKSRILDEGTYLNNKIYIYYYYESYWYAVPVFPAEKLIAVLDSGSAVSRLYLKLNPSNNMMVFFNVGLNFAWQYFYIINQCQDRKFLTHAKREVLANKDLMVSIPDTTGYFNPNIMNMKKLYLLLDDFSSQSKDLVPVLNQIWTLENQDFSKLDNAKAYEQTKQILDLIDKGNVIKKADKCLLYLKAIHLNNLGWYALLDGKYNQTIDFCKRAIELDGEENLPFTNLAIAYVLTNQFERAEEIYLKYKNDYTDVTKSKAMKTAFLEDIHLFEQKGIKHPDFAKVKKILSN